MEFPESTCGAVAIVGLWLGSKLSETSKPLSMVGARILGPCLTTIWHSLRAFRAWLMMLRNPSSHRRGQKATEVGTCIWAPFQQVA